jgi:hypothetical protein
MVVRPAAQPQDLPRMNWSAAGCTWVLVLLMVLLLLLLVVAGRYTPLGVFVLALPPI